MDIVVRVEGPELDMLLDDLKTLLANRDQINCLEFMAQSDGQKLRVNRGIWSLPFGAVSHG